MTGGTHWLSFGSYFTIFALVTSSPDHALEAWGSPVPRQSWLSLRKGQEFNMNTQILSNAALAVYYFINYLLTRWSSFSRKSWKSTFCPGTWTPNKALFSNYALLTLNTQENVCEWTGTVRSGWNVPPRNDDKYLMTNHDLEQDHPDYRPIKLNISHFCKEI